MTLQTFQKLSVIFENNTDEIDQLGFMICDYFNMPYSDVDKLSPKAFLKLSQKVEREFNKVHYKPFYYRTIIETDANKISLGQFIEVQHWLKQGEIPAMHLVCASLLNNKTDHKEDAAKILNYDVRRILLDARKFLLSFNKLIKAYENLFDIEEQTEDKEEPHPFIEQFGWIYSAKQVAEFEGIKLNDAYDLPIIQALNALAYLKSEQQYNKKMNA